jgi:hypothetical protein
MWTELLADWSKIVSAQLAAFLPLLGMGAYLFASGAMETPPTRWDEGFLLAVGAYVLFFGVLGLAYLPMALMANALLGTSLAAWNPVFIVRSIVKIPREYFVCVAVVAGLTIASAVAELAISGAGLFLGGGIAVTFVELFTMGVQMRMFGLLYGWRQARLRWFE